MPILPSVITEITNHVFDPIVHQLIYRLIAKLGYTDLFSNNIYINTDYSSHSNTTDDKNNPILRGNRFVADVTYQMNPSSTKWNTANFNNTAAYGLSNTSLRNQNLLLMDRVSKISLWEMNKPCSVIMNCRMVFVNKAHAYQTPAMLNNVYYDGSVIETNDLFFDYQLPGDILKVLQKLYELRELDINFYDYVRFGSSGILGYDLNKKTADRPEWIINKANVQMLSSVEYNDDQPDGKKTGSSVNSFEVPFVYTFQFNVPSIVFLEYPIIVNNKLVPFEYIPVDKVNTPPAYHGNMIVRDINEYYQKYKANPTFCYKCPFYEDWNVSSSAMPRTYSQDPFYIGTLLIDDPEAKQVIDLTGDIGDGNKLHPLIIELIRVQKERSFNYNSLINIAVYKDNNILDKKEYTLTFTEDNRIELSFYTREINFIYRLVLSQITNPIFLDEDLWDVLFFYRRYLFRAKYIKHLLKKKIPWWKAKGLFLDRRTGCFYSPTSRKLLFCVDDDGRVYRPITTELNGIGRQYFEDMTFNPVGGHVNGTDTALRILRTDITS